MKNQDFINIIKNEKYKLLQEYIICSKYDLEKIIYQYYPETNLEFSIPHMNNMFLEIPEKLWLTLRELYDELGLLYTTQTEIKDLNISVRLYNILTKRVKDMRYLSNVKDLINYLEELKPIRIRGIGKKMAKEIETILYFTKKS